MDDRHPSRQAQRPAGAGLCDACLHARVITSDRASVFVMCARAATDAQFPKYPQLPVTSCRGHERRQT